MIVIDSLQKWKDFLGHPSDEMVYKTLKATTQLRAEQVESERTELNSIEKEALTSAFY